MENAKRNKLGNHAKLNIFITLFENQAFSEFTIDQERNGRKQLERLELAVKHVDLDDVIQIADAVGCSYHIHAIDTGEDWTNRFKITID